MIPSLDEALCVFFTLVTVVTVSKLETDKGGIELNEVSSGSEMKEVGI